MAGQSVQDTEDTLDIRLVSSEHGKRKVTIHGDIKGKRLYSNSKDLETHLTL